MMPDPSPSNADSLKLQLLTARKKDVVAGQSGQFTYPGDPRDPAVNCDTHYVSRHRTLPIVSPTCYHVGLPRRDHLVLHTDENAIFLEK